MPSESVNFNHFPSEGERHKQLDRYIREMATSITNRVTDLHRSGHQKEDDDDVDGVRIITLAGTNDGATLRKEVDGKPARESGKPEEEEPLKAYVNSNYQAFNNSIMFSGSYQANDPGVSMEILDFAEPAHRHKAGKEGKKVKKKKKEKGATKSDGDHHSGHSDGDS